MQGSAVINPEEDIKVSFGYQCNGRSSRCCEVCDGYDIPSGIKLKRNSGSFSCLSGAAVSANATLANTNICNGLFDAEILPSWDSPKSFRKIPSSPSLSKLDMLSSSLQSNMSNLSFSPSSQSDPSESECYLWKPMSAPSRNDSFLNSMEVQVAGGAAGEDRVQAVCSEEDGWLFCAIYDGFNGRDAADFLAGTFYETIGFFFNLLDSERKLDLSGSLECLNSTGSIQHKVEEKQISLDGKTAPRNVNNKNMSVNNVKRRAPCMKLERSSDAFRKQVIDSLRLALNKAESDFLYMVEQEMVERPDLVSIGSCVLVVLLIGKDLYTLNLGDSRAVLATFNEVSVDEHEGLKAIQLTDSHTVDDEAERCQLLRDHPDDDRTVYYGKVKGKLKVTRALGVGYLKKKNMNDALMGILRVHNLLSPPYVSVEPSLNVHRISKHDHFVIVASDGLFDFFSNDEAVKLVHSYILSTPFGDPAKYLVEQLVAKAADCAGFSVEELMSVPAGRRRKYHDDVTVIVIMLGTNQRTSKASTCL